MRICWSGFSKTNKGSESVLTTILTIYSFGLRGNYGFYSTKKHGFRTKKHGKARKMRQKTDAFAFWTSMPQVRILSLRPIRKRTACRPISYCLQFYISNRRLRRRRKTCASLRSVTAKLTASQVQNPVTPIKKQTATEQWVRFLSEKSP